MKKILFLTAVIFALTISAQAQVGDVKQKPFKKFVLTLKRAPKILTGGWSLIDDNGAAYKAILAPKSYTVNIIPMSFNYDLYYGQGVFFNIKSTFCNFKKNKTVNGEKLDNANLLFSLDLNTSISLNSVYNINYELLKLNKNILDFRLIGGF
jgi:hypothetical protein